MKKRLIFLIAAIFLFSLQFAAGANFSKENAVLWLDTNINPLDDSAATSLSLAVLSSSNLDISSKLQTFLQNNPERNCYPKARCNLQDTALTLISLDSLGEPTDNIISWLSSKEKVAKTQADWLIQIFSTGSGRCTITHESIGNRFVFVNGTTNQLKLDDRLIDWVNIRQDLGIEITNATEDFIIDCSDLGGSTILSLIRYSTDEFRIVQQEDSNQATLRLKDVCYGETSCDKQGTFLASFALHLAGEKLNTLQYLKDNAASELDYAILYDITQDERYSDLLFTSQNEAGSWNNDAFLTSIVLYSLRDSSDNKAQKALIWLKLKQKTNGQIGNSQLDTAAALFFALEADIINRPTTGDGGAGAYCGDNVVNKELGEECDGTSDTKKEGALEDCQGLCTGSCACRKIECKVDEDCLPGKKCDEKTSTCFSPETSRQCSSDDDCPSGYSCDVVSRSCKLLEEEKQTCSSDKDCNEDETCDRVTETCIPKQEDECGDGTCSRDEDEVSCPEDCEKTTSPPAKKSLWWVWILVFLAGLGILIFILYKKFLKQTPLEPESYFESPSTKGKKPFNPKGHPSQDELEQQIDTSIKEAQELLKHK
ncbi:MAG TPA: hypothetical protein VJH95_05610 [Candidatus Nanoarchaeia archaeon]|nr:hypothetical protein [Candidatus Nanoarchaeia archaeon]